MTGPTTLAEWVRRVNDDPENAHIGRWSSFVLRAGVDDGPDVLLRYDRAVLSVEPVAGDAAADIELRGPRSAWRELADASAAPRRHDLLALSKAPDGIRITGGRDQLLRHLRVLNRLVELGRTDD